MDTVTINSQNYQLTDFNCLGNEFYSINLVIDEDHTLPFDQLFDSTIKMGEEFLQVKIDIPSHGISGLYFIESISRTGYKKINGYTSTIYFVKQPRD